MQKNHPQCCQRHQSVHVFFLFLCLCSMFTLITKCMEKWRAVRKSYDPDDQYNSTHTHIHAHRPSCNTTSFRPFSSSISMCFLFLFWIPTRHKNLLFNAFGFAFIFMLLYFRGLNIRKEKEKTCFSIYSTLVAYYFAREYTKIYIKIHKRKPT